MVRQKSWLMGYCRLLPALLLIATLFMMVLAPAPKVFATDPSEICVPPHNDDTKVPSGWFSARFVNRATIEVTYTPNGNCVQPSSQSSAYIYGSVQFSSLVNGQLTDRDTADDQFEYVLRQNGGSSDEESRLDNFSGSLDDNGATNDAFGGQDRIISAGDLQSFLNEVEYTMGFEEDLVTANCEGVKNYNWILSDVPDNGIGMEWRCGVSTRNSDNGFRVGTFFSNLENFNITYGVVGEGDQTTIQHVSAGEQGSRTFQWCASFNRFIADGCNQGNLYIDTTPEVLGQIDTGIRNFDILRQGSSERVTVVVAGATNPSSVDTGSINDSQGAGEDDSCESDSGVLGWIMCPLVGILDSVVGWLDGTIQDQLIVDESLYGNSTDGGLFQSWQQIRNIAYIILIPIMLVMVIGTALGFEVFSAYTVKRALPRMVIAVIFITLSWYICVFLIDLFNVIGTGTLGIITSPFDGGASSLRDALINAQIIQAGGSGAETAASGAAALGLLAGGAFVGFATGVVTVGILLSTLFSAVLVLGVALLILVARQMFILGLLLIAPLAILAWIFPGNDKFWKIWWSSFSKLLMMFPLIMGIIGIGRVFGYVIGEAGVADSRNTIITTITVIAAYIIPFAAIPFAFKWVGGLFGNLAGMVNDREKGLLDRGKKKRAEKRAEGLSNFKAGTGTGFAQKNAFARRAGMGIGAGVGGGKGFLGYGDKGKARLDQMNRQNAVDQVMKNPAWNGVNQDDNALHAGVLLQDMSKADAIKELMKSKAQGGRGLEASEAQRAATAWGASGLGGRASAIAAAQQLVSTGTGYNDLNDMTQTLARAAGGNTSTATSMAGFANSETKKTGRHDLAPSFSTLSGLVADAQKGSQYGVDSGYTAKMDAAAAKTTESSSLYELLNGKPKSLENQARAHAKVLQAPAPTMPPPLAVGSTPQQAAAHKQATKVYQESSDARLNASAFFKEVKENLPNAKGGNRDVIMKMTNGEGEYVGLPQIVEAHDSVKTGRTRGTREETYGDLAKDRKRAYERPDPNNTT